MESKKFKMSMTFIKVFMVVSWLLFLSYQANEMSAKTISGWNFECEVLNDDGPTGEIVNLFLSGTRERGVDVDPYFQITELGAAHYLTDSGKTGSVSSGQTEYSYENDIISLTYRQTRGTSGLWDSMFCVVNKKSYAWLVFISRKAEFGRVIL